MVVFFVIKLLWREKTEVPTDAHAFMTIVPQDASVVFISPDGEKKTQITSTQKLFTNDAYMLVESGSAQGSISGTTLDIDEHTKISFKESSHTGDVFAMESGRIWVQWGDRGAIISMKNITVQVPTDHIILAEKSRTDFDTVYAIKGESTIITPIGQYTLKPKDRIMISTSDINNPQTRLTDLAQAIDESITQNTLFVRNNGSTYITSNTEVLWAWDTSTGNILSGSGEANILGSRFVTITQPVDGSTVKTKAITVMGDIHNDAVRRVTIGDIDASVSPVNQNFILQEFALKDEINNIVYKAYDANNQILEKGVLVVYGPKNTGAVSTLVPQNSPISSKDFLITSPKSNPYTTTDSYVRVQGTVPANTVQYIVVNDFRLQKYIPNSTTWYYHANAEIGTMKDGMNLYTIKFYDANNTVLYTQLFTIIKDAKPSPSE